MDFCERLRAANDRVLADAVSNRSNAVLGLFFETMEFCDEYHNLNPNKNTQETRKFGRK